MSEEPGWRLPDPALLLLRRLECLVLVGLPGLVAAVVVTVLAGPLPGLATLLVALVATGVALVTVERRVAAWGWTERDDALLVRRGVLVRRLTMVPLPSVQYVDLTAGPLDRRLGIARVTLHTAAAAADASVPGLRRAEAEQLRDRLAALGRARTGP